MLIELFNSDGSIFAGTTIYGKVIDIGEMNEPKNRKEPSFNHILW